MEGSTRTKMIEEIMRNLINLPEEDIRMVMFFVRGLTEGNSKAKLTYN